MIAGWIALGLSAPPFALGLWNLRLFRKPGLAAAPPPISVLIPARNEEGNIGPAVAAVLASEGVTLEVVVLDDGSTDATPAILAAIADPRLRVATGGVLPSGWSGKQHACATLATLARHDLLVFVDADVRLAPDALSRMAGFMEGSAMGGGNSDGAGSAAGVGRRTEASSAAGPHSAAGLGSAAGPHSAIGLASGFPRQIVVTWSERLLLPLIHFLLLGYLPMAQMRRSLAVGLGAGCGQLFIARRAAYEAAGGHAAIRASLHDGLTLPRAFRRAGFATDLFDATEFATCRMYSSAAQVWEGLGKNATEGMAKPVPLLLWTLILGGGQILPAVLMLAAPSSAAMLALVFSTGLRLILASRFRQPEETALLHPLGVAALLVVQWAALVRSLRGRPSTWRGRAYPAA